MLELIAKYAIDQGLTVRPGFTVKTVKWLIQLSANGEYVGIQELGNASDKKNPGLEFRDCPEFPANLMTKGGMAHPLVETLNVVALIGKSREASATPEDDVKHSFFQSLLEDDELVQKLPEAQVAANWLKTPDTLDKVRADLYAHKAKAGDKATIAVGNVWLVTSSVTIDWWQAYLMRSSASGDEGLAICFVTGGLVRPLASHEQVSGLKSVGGRGSDRLISFNKDAFKSYGLRDGENACVSAESASAYRAGLDDLIRHGKKLGPLLVGYWYSGKLDRELDPLLSGLIDDDDEVDRLSARMRAQTLLSSLDTGERADLAGYRYHILNLKGFSGRVRVMDWQEGPFRDLVRATNAWFNDLAICGLGTEYAKTPTLESLLFTHLRRRKPSDNFESWLAPSTPFAVPLFCAAIRLTLRDGVVAGGYPLPMSSIHRILPLITHDFSTGDYVRIADELGHRVAQGRDLGLRYSRLTATMALLKAQIIRSPKSKYGKDMKPNLNEQHPSKAYQAGRLFAVLAEIQDASDNDVKATIVQRFYPSASSTPALVFGRLISLSQFHLRKIEREKPGLYRHLQMKAAFIWNQVRDDLPTTFPLEDRTLFALGYYQQIAKNEMDRLNRKASNTSDEKTETRE